MRAVTTNFAVVNSAKTKRPHYVAEVSFNRNNSDLQYITDSDTTAVPSYVIDPDDFYTTNELQELNTNNELGFSADAFYGASTSFSFDRTVLAVTSAPWDGVTEYGTGYAEVRTWSNSAQKYGSPTQLDPGGITSADHFGMRAVVSGNGEYIFVNSLKDNVTATSAGATYVWQLVSGTWTYRARLESSDIEANDKFGWHISCSYDGLTLLATAPFENSNQGKAYILEATASDWSTYDETILTPSTRTTNYVFGYDGKISSDGRVVFLSEVKSNNNGKVYYFVKGSSGTGSHWPSSENGYIEAFDEDTSDFFGYGNWATKFSGTFNEYSTNSIACSYGGDVLAIGASGWDDTDGNNFGAVYIYKWNQQTESFIFSERLTPTQTASYNYDYLFGAHVDMDLYGDRILVGSQNETTSGGDTGGGYVYLFEKTKDGYVLLKKIEDSTLQAEQYAGFTCSISGDGKFVANNIINWDYSGDTNVGRVRIVDAYATVAYKGYLVQDSLSGSTQKIDPLNATSSIGNISFNILDKDSAITTLINNRLERGFGLRNMRVRVYVGYEGLEWDDYNLIQTQIIQDITYTEGQYEVQCKDIQRSAVQDIFDPKLTNLTASIAASSITLPVSGTSKFKLIKHGTSYTDAPSQSVCYVEIDKEIIRCSAISPTSFTVENVETTLASGVTANASTISLSSTSGIATSGLGYVQDSATGLTTSEVRWTGITGTQLTGVTGLDNAFTTNDIFIYSKGRGVLGTRAAEHEVDTSKTNDRKTTVKEFIYLELPAVKMAYALLTGNLYGDGETLPDHWHLGIDTDYVASSQFTNIGTDIWDTSDDTAGVVLRFEGLSKTEGKRFIETEIMKIIGCFMPVLSDGQLGLKRMTGVLSNSAYIGTFDNSNIVSYSGLKHALDKVANVYVITWNWNNEKRALTRKDVFYDPYSYSTHQVAKPIEIEAKGVHGTRFTRKILAQQFDALRDRYAGPPQLMSLTVLPSQNLYEVGDIVRVNTSNIRDFASSALTINRSMEVQQVKINWGTGQVTYDLFGSSQKAIHTPEWDDSSVLDASFYTSSGTNLTASSAALTTTTSGGVLHITASGSLTGVDDLSSSTATSDNTQGIFYYDGDVQIDAGVTISATKNIQFNINGHLQINGKIDLAGQGHAGATTSASTTLTADFRSTDTTMYVTSTASFPSSGYVWVSGTLLPYTGKTGTTFTGCDTGLSFNLILGKSGSSVLEKPNEGTQGFIGNTLSSGGINVGASLTTGTVAASVEGLLVEGQNKKLPFLTLTNNSSSISGIPSSLIGTSGSSGQHSSGGLAFPWLNVTEGVVGGAGGASGGGFICVCKGASFGISGEIDTSGLSGSMGALHDVGFNVYSGEGSPGFPGGVYFLLDGTDVLPPDNNITALYRNSNPKGVRLLSPYASWRPDGTGDIDVFSNYHSYYVGQYYDSENPSSDLDVSNEVFHFQYILPDESSNLEEDTGLTADVPLGISVTPVSVTKATMNQTAFEISVTPPSPLGNYKYAHIYVRKAGTSAWQDVGYAGSTDEVIYGPIPADGSTYEIKAHSVSFETIFETYIGRWVERTTKTSAEVESPEFIIKRITASTGVGAVISTGSSLGTSSTVGDGSGSSNGVIIDENGVRGFPVDSTSASVHLNPADGTLTFDGIGNTANLVASKYSRYEENTLPSLYVYIFDTPELDTTTSQLGNNSLKLTTNSSSSGVLRLAPDTSTYNIPVNANRKYIASCYVRSDAASQNVQFDLFTSSGNELSTTVTTSATPNTWTRIYAEVDMSAFAATSLTFGILVSGHTSGDIFWFDGFMLEEKVSGQTEASPYINNGDFIDRLTTGLEIAQGYIKNGNNIVIDFANKKISINDATFGNQGIQIDYNSGTPRLYVGNGANKFMNFDGTDLILGEDSKFYGASTYDNDSLFYQTFFDSIDNFNSATSGTSSAISLNSTLGSLNVTVDTGASDYALFGKTLYHSLTTPSWGNNRRLKFRLGSISLASPTCDLFIGTGTDTASGIFIYYDNGTWKGYSVNSGVSTTINFSSTPMLNSTLEIEWVPATSVEFFVNGVSQGSITNSTYLPTGTNSAAQILYIALKRTAGGDGVTRYINIGEFKFNEGY